MKPRTSCKRGLHELTPENTITLRNGHRLCRDCQEIRRIRLSRGTLTFPTYGKRKTPSGDWLIDPSWRGDNIRQSMFPWDVEMSRMPAWDDDPFVFVENDTASVLSELAAGREVGGRIIGRETGTDPVAEVMLRIEKAIEKTRKKSKKSRQLAEIWAIGEIERRRYRLEKHQAPVIMGRLGGLKGGHARAAKMTAEERSESARYAAKKRWTRSSRKPKKLVTGVPPEMFGIRSCAQIGLHAPHLWSVGDEGYRCPGVEASVLRRTSQGWAQPSGPSRYFRRTTR